MKKIHGTYSIQPLSITDIVVADNAGIAESKLHLSYSTESLYSDINDVSSYLSEHVTTTSNPHSPALRQTTLITEDIQTNESAEDRTIYISNKGGGKADVDIDGGVSALSADIIGNVNIGGSVTISSNILVEGNMTVTGSSTVVNSTVIDHDRMIVSPSSASNLPAIVVAPDATDFTGETADDNYTGSLVDLQTRRAGLNRTVLLVDSSGNIWVYGGTINIGTSALSNISNELVSDEGIKAPYFNAFSAGYKYKSLADTDLNVKVVDFRLSDNTVFFSVSKNGNVKASSFTVGSGIGMSWDALSSSVLVSDNVTFAPATTLDLKDSFLRFSATGKNTWRVLNRNSTVSFYYADEQVPQVEIGDQLISVNSDDISFNDATAEGDVHVKGDITVNASSTIAGLSLTSHDHSGGSMGQNIPMSSVTGLTAFVNNSTSNIKSCVDEMTTGNVSNGISVSYNQNTGKLDFDINDFTITAGGDAIGTVTITNLANATFDLDIKDSDKVGGLSVTAGSVNNEASKVVKTDASGKVHFGEIETAASAGNTDTIVNVYASKDGYIRKYTPENFAKQILALGNTTKNSHTHTDVNGFTPLRGSSTFNGTTGRVVMLPSSRANTNYSVSVTPTANTEGHLGDVWVIKGTDRFTVYNTGTSRVSFDYILLG